MAAGMRGHGSRADGASARAALSVLRLREPLERLYRDCDYAARVEHDAIGFPLRYPAAADRELVALLTACLAYGRVGLWRRGRGEGVGAMGARPAAFVRGFEPERDAAAFAGFLYRFNRPRALVAFCLAARDLLATWGSLEACFMAGYSADDPHVGPALERFTRGFLGADLKRVFPRGRLSRGYRHLFPQPSTGGPCKRLHLFLRWMVRSEPPDFGLWRQVPPAKLLIPVDTHVARRGRALRQGPGGRARGARVAPARRRGGAG